MPNTLLSNISKFIIYPIIIGIVASLIAAYIFFFNTKQETEITFKLDGWITIGSVKESDLPNLKLMLDSQNVDNIMKVSWKIINTGKKGIDKFENGLSINVPNELHIYKAIIFEKSKFLKVCNSLSIKNNLATIDTLGIFNPNDYMKVDFYLINMKDQDITSNLFDKWTLIGKALDLKIEKDILTEQEKNEEKEDQRKKSIIISGILAVLTSMSSMYIIYLFRRRYKEKNYDLIANKIDINDKIIDSLEDPKKDKLTNRGDK